MNLKALRQKKTDLLAEADRIFNSASTENRSLTAAEIARDDAINAELETLAGDISRAERHAERQREIPALHNPNAAREAAEQEGKFASLGEQMMAVARAGMPNGQADRRLQWMGGGVSAGPSGMSEDIGSDGGFLVQTDFVDGLLQNTWDNGEIASRIQKIGVGPNSNGIKINGVDETSRANGSRSGGIQAFWTGEAQLFTASQPKFKKIGMELDKLTGLCYATDELLRDSTALGQWLLGAFDEEFTFKIEDAVVNGTGNGMPLGYLNSGAVITVNKEAGQANTTIVAENILKMFSRMPARNRKNAVWLINQDAEPQLYQLNVKIKNVAGNENVGGINVPPVVYVPPGTNGNEFGLLMGRPVIPVEYAATLGTPGDIQFVDLYQYLGIDKGATEAASSIHVRFLYDETAFRFIYRFNGQPKQAAPITPFKGANTLSPFVVLQQR